MKYVFYILAFLCLFLVGCTVWSDLTTSDVPNEPSPVAAGIETAIKTAADEAAKNPTPGGLIWAAILAASAGAAECGRRYVKKKKKEAVEGGTNP